MARPKDHLFTKDDIRLEKSLFAIMNKARSKPGPGTEGIINRSLDTLSDLYKLINEREAIGKQL